jgi:undecaprenyl-diphosphatase
MTWPIALLLAVLQGLTEFLPVSSSGHLALVQNAIERFTGTPLAEALAFDIIVHLGTMLAVVLYFRRDLGSLLLSLRPGQGAGQDTPAARTSRRELFFLVLSLFPTAIIGLALRPLASSMLHRPALVAGLIGVTGIILLLTRSRGRLDNPATTGEFTLARALAMGAAQGLAVLPGLSRSGLTIAAGLAAGLSPLAAFRMSFLMSIPTVAGAAILELGGHPEALAQLGWPAAGAAVVACLVALVALAILSRTLRRGQFHLFSWYCFAVAALGILYFTLGGGQ